MIPQNKHRSKKVIFSVLGLVLFAGAVFGIWKGAQPAEAQDLERPVTEKAGPVDTSEHIADRYIVVFSEDALAGYDGNVPGYPKAPRLGRKARLNVKDRRAERYVDFLERQQLSHEAKIAQVLGRPLEVTRRMQHALNAIVAKLSPAEAEQVSRLQEVILVDPVRDVPMDTDVGPLLIGAEPIWNGTNPGSTAGAQGEGTVIGVIDSGINFGSPSFAAIDPIDGYQHINPLGAGNYLGTCSGAGVDVGRCNAKLIGGYDFVCAAPGNQCNIAGIREEPGFGDTNGHGSHTASTVAGNRRDVSVLTAVRRISGVAPRANVVAYDVCYTNTTTGQGLCPNVSSATAVNQAIADGVVDSLNFSIGGGTSPWTDAVSLAFLNATDAGIYVATSAGNDGPGANTMGHLEPWTASTAAAQHGRAGISYAVDITGPGTVPAGLTMMPANEGTLGIAHTAPINAPLVVSPTYAAVDDACTSMPAGTFQGAIAVVRRGTCGFAIKVNTAVAAGAIAVVIANNAGATGLIPQVAGTTVPVFGLSQNQGDAVRAFALANPGTTASIPYPAVIFSNNPDQLAAFSSRGPAGNLDLVKPNMTAPGVSVLAAVSGTTLTGSELATAFYNGTSMASPHNAGSSLLLRQLKPGWTASEIKSALEMTAAQAVVKEDGTTQASPHEMGGGRIRVNLAATAGLVLNETKANFQAANPAAGGSASTLNLPSMAKRGCVGQCQFVRTFRSTLSSSRTWQAGLQSIAGTVSPSMFNVAPGGTVTLTITIDSSSIAPDGAFNFGRLVLEPLGVPTGIAIDGTLGLPIAVTVPPPAIALNPATQNVSLVAGHAGTANFSVLNNGGYQLDYNIDNTGSGLTSVYNANNTGVGSGFRASIYSDQTNPKSQFAADDISLSTATTIKSIYSEGFIVSGLAMPAAATALTWSIYPDVGGFPAGNPQSNPGAAVWTYTTTAAGAGVTITGGNMRLDLAAAGQNVSLPAGKYWVAVNTASTFANRWAWYGSNTGTGGGFATISVNSAGVGSWVVNSAFAGLSLQIDGEVACGAPWIGASTPASGTVLGGGSQAIQTVLTTNGMSAGDYTGAVCVASNDTLRPKVAEVIRLTLTPNDPPTVSVIDDISTNEDTPTPAILFTIGDAQSPADALTASAASSDPSLIPDSNIALGGTGPDRTVMVTPFADRAGFADISITVTDQGGLTATETFRVTVVEVNDQPTITAASGIVRQQAAGPSVSQIATVADIDNVPATLAVTVNGGSSATVNGVTVSSITINAAGVVNASVAAACGAGNASFTLRATDAGGLFSQAALAVSVTNETTPPVINPIASIVATLPNTSATSMPIAFPLPTATDNCPGVTVTTNPVSGSNFNVGVTTVTVTAVDAVGNTAQSSFTVTVRYNFTGFFGRAQSAPAMNYVGAGNTVPVGFSLGGNKGFNIFTAGSPSSQQVNCSSLAPMGVAASATLSPGMIFQSGQYTFYWQTSEAWRGTCRVLSVGLNDGTTRTLNFTFFQ